MKIYLLYAIYVPVCTCWMIVDLIHALFESLGLFVKSKIEIEHIKRQGGE